MTRVFHPSRFASLGQSDQSGKMQSCQSSDGAMTPPPVYPLSLLPRAEKCKSWTYPGAVEIEICHPVAALAGNAIRLDEPITRHAIRRARMRIRPPEFDRPAKSRRR
jgi:hypothetical protein